MNKEALIEALNQFYKKIKTVEDREDAEFIRTGMERALAEFIGDAEVSLIVNSILEYF